MFIAPKISDTVIRSGLRFIPGGDWLHSHGLDQEHSSALRSSLEPPLRHKKKKQLDPKTYLTNANVIKKL